MIIKPKFNVPLVDEQSDPFWDRIAEIDKALGRKPTPTNMRHKVNVLAEQMSEVDIRPINYGVTHGSKTLQGSEVGRALWEELFFRPSADGSVWARYQTPV